MNINKKICPPDKILNPKTNRCIKINGTTAKKLFLNKKKSEKPTEIKSISSEKPTEIKSISSKISKKKSISSKNSNKIKSISSKNSNKISNVRI